MAFSLHWCVYKGVCCNRKCVSSSEWWFKKKKKLENTAVCHQKNHSHTLCCTSPVAALQWAVASSKPPDYAGSIKLTASANFTRHRIVSIGPRRCQSGWYTVNYLSPHLDLTFQYITSSTPLDYFIIIIFYLLKCKKKKKKLNSWGNSFVYWPQQWMNSGKNFTEWKMCMHLFIWRLLSTSSAC